MNQRRRWLVYFLVLFFVMITACAPAAVARETPTADAPVNVAATLTPEVSSPVATDTLSAPFTVTPTLRPGWPVYTLKAELPNSPEKMTLYAQVIPAGLPDDQRLAALMAQLKISGKVSTRVSEGGNQTMDITGDAASLMLDSVDPLIMVLNLGPAVPDASTPAKIIPPEERAQTAKSFLEERKLLDFPYIMEPPRMSRDRDRSIRVVPLIDGYPLYDYDPLNGRLLVWFNAEGEVSTVFWRPLKLFAGDPVSIQPAAAAWDKFVRGDLPQDGKGQCWQVMTFDPNEPNANAMLDSPSCVNWGSGPNPSFNAATINDVKLVYFAGDLSLGMSPFAIPDDSPARLVFPIWQFSGVTSDGRDLVALWPAMQAP